MQRSRARLRGVPCGRRAVSKRAPSVPPWSVARVAHLLVSKVVTVLCSCVPCRENSVCD